MVIPYPGIILRPTGIPKWRTKPARLLAEKALLIQKDKFYPQVYSAQQENGRHR
jgi:hypothetical protein